MQTLMGWQTGIRIDEAKEAVATWQTIQTSEQTITDKELCKKICGNSLLAEVCRRRGVSWGWSPPWFYPFLCLRWMGRSLLFLLSFPLSLISGIYANFWFMRKMAQLAPITDVEKQALGDDFYRHHANRDKTVVKYLEEVQREIRARSGSDVTTTIGETDGLASCHYNSWLHIVTLPKRIVDRSTSKTQETKYPPAIGKDTNGRRLFAYKLAIAAHECGHAEQRTFIVCWHVGTVVASIAVALLCLFSPLALFIEVALCIALAIGVPAGQFLYEVNASRRGLANLVGLGYLTTPEEAEMAAHTLHVAASTYLLSLAMEVGRVGYQLLSLFAQNSRMQESNQFARNLH
ncbi:MAG: zinc metallopeptidase [Puniceicoccales bacterium]|nr:zinc metallopeptidase [Puniceicoccales bacterium]